MRFQSVYNAITGFAILLCFCLNLFCAMTSIDAKHEQKISAENTMKCVKLFEKDVEQDMKVYSSLMVIQKTVDEHDKILGRYK